VSLAILWDIDSLSATTCAIWRVMLQDAYNSRMSSEASLRSVRLTDDVANRLDAWRERENRSRSNAANVLLGKVLRAEPEPESKVSE
jgi:hypothetical protein